VVFILLKLKIACSLPRNGSATTKAKIILKLKTWRDSREQRPKVVAMTDSLDPAMDASSPLSEVGEKRMACVLLKPLLVLGT
jgi:hypothetical protein